MIEDYVRIATVISAYDADTMTVEVDLGYRTYARVPLRLNRINAPEMGTTEGRLAKQFLLKYIPPGTSIVVKTFKNPTDKYGRWLAEIYLGEVNVNDYLVQNGHAVYREY